MDNLWVFDIECNGFNPDKIWCIGASRGSDRGVRTTTSYKSMSNLFTKPDAIYVAHNGIRFDIPILERLLGIEVKGLVVDTLALSWYLYPTRLKHGLAEWGEEFGVPKPVVEDWDDQPIEVYLERVEEDVKINTLLWEKMYKDLLKMYKTEEEVFRFIRYLSFKMDCAREQEDMRWKLDVELATKTYNELNNLMEVRFEELEKAMPSIPIRKTRKCPPKPYKKNGELSVAGLAWEELCKSKGLPTTHKTPIEIIDGYKPPNAGSPLQVKDWLYSLGWKPTTLKFTRNKKTNETKEIPQINNKAGDDICNSIKLLIDKAPQLKVLEGLSILKHRVGLLKGLLGNVSDDGYVKARIKGLTNTLRFQHTEVVNLPAIDKPYGEVIRGCLTCIDGETLMGSDMEALEDKTKQHYMLPHDPEYVAKMQAKGYCPHVDIAVLAGYLGTEEETRHTTGEFIDADDKYYIKAQRKKAKPVNYGSVYGQKPAGLAKETGMTLREATKLFDIYWERNWSVEAIAKEQIVRRFNGGKWLLNPVSKFYYSLRSDKDRFSTLNQGTGVFCFDTWVMNMRELGLKMCGQMHDEVIAPIDLGEEERVNKLVQSAIDMTNEELKLNVKLACDVQFGKTYAQIH